MGLLSLNRSTWVTMAIGMVACVAITTYPIAGHSKGVLRSLDAAALATPYRSITSTGPLSDVFLGNDLSAQIAYAGDSLYEVYPPNSVPADYGTFLVVDDVLYAPDFAAHDGGTATVNLGTYTVYTAISQSGVLGSGTASDPYRVVTNSAVGTTGLLVEQTDSYVVGDEYYRTDMVFSNTTATPVDAILYRAMDCYLSGSDDGYGFVSGSAAGCSVNPNNAPPGRIQQLVPVTPGNAYYQAGYSEVWAAIGARTGFNNTCRCGELIDNGVGISWNISVPANGTLTVAHYTVFSPSGLAAISTSKTADQAQSAPGDTNGYTITFTNPNSAAVTLTSISDTLPVGFVYVVGSSSGATGTDPVVNGQELTWSGSFNLPANGTLQQRFQVRVSSTPGTYFNEAGGVAVRYPVAPTAAVAPIVVTGPAGQATPVPGLGGAGLLGLALLIGLAGAMAAKRRP